MVPNISPSGGDDYDVIMRQAQRCGFSGAYFSIILVGGRSSNILAYVLFPKDRMSAKELIFMLIR